MSCSTDAAVRNWVATQALPGISNASVDQILALYPNDPTQGSPFNTGTANQAFPHFKQLAALESDLEFQGLRRFFLNRTWNHQPLWSWLSKLYKDLRGIGSGTSTDLINLFGPGEPPDYFIKSITRGDPNNGAELLWPQWEATSPRILTITNESVSFSIIDDTFREEGINLLASLLSESPQ